MLQHNEIQDTPVAGAPPANTTSANALHERLTKAKRAFSTRRADLTRVASLAHGHPPKTGDLVLATVTEVGHHGRIETPHGRRAVLHEGDEILVAYGARYAPDQFEAVVPANLDPCDLVASGGIAAHMLTRHAKVRRPTAITPLGLLADDAGTRLNLSQFAIRATSQRPPARNVIAVVGTSMNAGKTTAAASLIRGLTRCGVRVGACKVTGTGSGGDLWSMIDAGAVRALDFTDAGYSSTSGIDPTHIEAAAHGLVSELEADDNIDVVVVEIADGLLQRETAALLSPPSSFVTRLDSIILAAADAMGALAGVEWLTQRKLPIRAVTGLLTASPLATREAQFGVAYEVIATKLLADPAHAARLSLGAAPANRISIVS